MNGLLAKKSFFDGWDNILRLLVLNAIFGVLVYFIRKIDFAWGSLGILVLFCCHFAGVNGIVSKWSKGEEASFSDYFAIFHKRFRHFLLFLAIVCAGFFYFTFFIPVFFQTGIFYLQVFACLIIGIFILLLFALLFFFPLSILCPDDRSLKTLSKCFLIMLDNRRFAFFCIVKDFGDLGLSLLTKFIVPGFCGICITQMNAVVFLMKKYSWIKKNKQSDSHLLPEVFMPDTTTEINNRSLKDCFYPFFHK